MFPFDMSNCLRRLRGGVTLLVKGEMKGAGMDDQDRQAAADAALMMLYEWLRKGNAASPSAMTRDERRAYDRQKKAESRARVKDLMREGDTPPTADNVRQALADAACMVLATGGPGAEQVRKALELAFRARPGVPLQIETDCRNGKIKPLLARVRFRPPAFLRTPRRTDRKSVVGCRPEGHFHPVVTGEDDVDIAVAAAVAILRGRGRRKGRYRGQRSQDGSAPEHEADGPAARVSRLLGFDPLCDGRLLAALAALKHVASLDLDHARSPPWVRQARRVLGPPPGPHASGRGAAFACPPERGAAAGFLLSAASARRLSLRGGVHRPARPVLVNDLGSERPSASDPGLPQTICGRPKSPALVPR